MKNNKKIGYQLKVYPAKRGREAYRVFQISGDASFDDLCFSILGQFNFDSSHMYEICFNNNYDDNLQCSAASGSTRNTSNTTLNDVGLTKGQKFIFHYDFGDDWKFVVSVVKVLEDFSSSSVIKLKEKGKISQYYDYDEEDFDEE